MPSSGLLFKTALALAALLGGQGQASSEVTVSIERVDGDGWRVEGSFFAEASRQLAWSVLTDYERIPDFVGGLKASRLQGRLDGDILLEQEGRAGLYFFSRAVRVLLRIRESPGESIQFQDLARGDFLMYRGEWSLDEAPGGTTVRYLLWAHPAFPAPTFAEKRALVKVTRGLLENVRAEMHNRGHRESR